MEKQEKVVLTLDSYEHGIMIRALNELRNDMLEMCIRDREISMA